MRDPGGTLERADRDRRRRRRRRAPPGAGDRPRRRRAAGLQHGDQRGPPQHARRDRHHPPQRRRLVRLADARRLDALERAGRRHRARRHGRRRLDARPPASMWSRSAPDGQIGKVKRIASPDGVVGLVAAAGERRGRHAGVGRPSRRRRHATQPAQPLLRPRARPDRGARLRGHPHGRLDERLRARRQHRRRRGRPGDPGLGPRALRRRSLGGQQRRHERGPRDHCAGRQAVRRRRGSSPGGGCAT